MKLKIFSVHGVPIHFNPKTTNRLFNLFSSTKDDVELTNIANVNSKMKHLVFSLQDVLYSGTQKNGISKEIPFTQTINVFISNNFAYIEEKGDGYTKSIKRYFTEKYNFSFNDLVIGSKLIAAIKKQLSIRIMDIYVVDQFGDKLGELELLNEIDLMNLDSDIFVQSITFQPMKIINNGYITLHRTGEMSLSLNSFEDFKKWLIFIDRELGND